MRNMAILSTDPLGVAGTARDKAFLWCVGTAQAFPMCSTKRLGACVAEDAT